MLTARADGGYEPPAEFRAPAVAVADLDGDGRPDLIRDRLDYSTGVQVGMARADGGRTWTMVPMDTYPRELVAGDVTGDGRVAEDPSAPRAERHGARCGGANPSSMMRKGCERA